MPQAWLALEAELRSVVQRTIERGRVELALTIQLKQAPEVSVEVNEPFVRALHGAFEQARSCGLRVGELAAGDLLRSPQALIVREHGAELNAEQEGQVRDAAVAAVGGAIEELDAMRSREGEYLRVDLERRRAAVAELVRRAEAAAEQGRHALEARLVARVQELALDQQADAAVVAQEIVRVAARSDISEERARLEGHLAHWDAIAAAPGGCGRRLDFLLQEMNREVNTIGAKAEGVDVPELIVAAKAELEKLREQVQNVE